MPGNKKLFSIVDVPGRSPVLDGLGLMTEELRPGRGSAPALTAPALTTSTRTLFGLSRADLGALVSELGQPAYRAPQLEDALYRQR